jgi:cobalt-zinc-cadmium efflux system outer membrane protein
LQTGDLAKIDALRLEIEVARARTELADAQAATRDAEITLALVIGVEGQHLPFRANDIWPEPIPPVDIPVALDDRPDVAAAKARSDQADVAVSLAQAQQSRDVTVGVQFEHYPQVGSHANSVGLGLSVPLFLRHHYEGEIARAAADRRVANEALRTVRLGADAEVRRAQADLGAALEKLRQFRGTVLQRAQASADAAEYAYSRGALGLTDLLDARRALQEITLDSLAAEAAHAKALAAWRAATNPVYFSSNLP